MGDGKAFLDGIQPGDDCRQSGDDGIDVGDQAMEVHADGELIGGLYGLAIGRMFYGESMFSRRSNASKIAFAHLVRYLEAHEFGMIDCQMRTAHLASLGGREIPRSDFMERLNELTRSPHPRQRWTIDNLDLNW